MTSARRIRRSTAWSLLPAAIFAVLTACSHPDQAAPTRTEQPNILLVVADDHGCWATGAYGNHEVATPNIDRLAGEGLLLTSAYSPAPVCSPARASLLTGRLPSQHGIHDFLSEDPQVDRDWLAGEVTLPELLQRVGYRTALIGKWHCSSDSGPVQPGFDRWVSYDVRRDGWRNQYLHRGEVHLSDQGEPVTVSGYQTKHLVRFAAEFIADGDRSQPFFLLFAPTDTHAPFEGQPERWASRYRAARFSDVPRGETSHLPAAAAEFVMPEDPVEMLAQYYAAVSFADEQLGVLLDTLAARGELDRTLVVYTSDQGHMNGHHGLVGKANATLPQNLYEETVRVPMVLRWPDGGVPAGVRLDLPFDHLDLFATVIDAAGVRLSADEQRRISTPGASLLDRLQDPSKAWRTSQFAEHGNARMVVAGRWKLVRRYPPVDPRFGDELYDLVSDPRETVDLSAEQPERAAELGREIDRHFATYEVAERSGLRVLELPPYNGREPWRRLSERLAHGD